MQRSATSARHFGDRRRRGVVVVLAAGIASLLLAGCQPQMQKAASTIEGRLQEKYGQEFRVASIGAGYGTPDNSTLKATVAPVSDPALTFEATVKKDLSEVQDRFVGATAVRAVEQEYGAVLVKDWPDGSFARVWLDEDSEGEAPAAADTGELGIAPKAYFDVNPEVRPVAFVGVKGQGSAAEARQTAADVALKLQSISGRGKVFVFLVPNEDFARIAESAPSRQINELWFEALDFPSFAYVLEVDSEGATVIEDL